MNTDAGRDRRFLVLVFSPLVLGMLGSAILYMINTAEEEVVVDLPPPASVPEPKEPPWRPEGPTIPFDFGPRERSVPMVFSPDGRYIACGSDRLRDLDVVEIWDLKTGRVDRLEPSVKGRFEAVDALTYNSDGTLLAVCYSSRAIRIFDVKARQIIKTCVCKVKEAMWGSRAFTSNDHLRFVIRLPDERMQVSDWIPSGAAPEPLFVFPSASTFPMAMSRDGRLEIVDAGKNPTVFDLDGGKELFSLPAPSVAAFVPGRDELLVKNGRTLRLVSLSSGRLLGSLELNQAHHVYAHYIDVSSDGTLAALACNDSVILVNLREMKIIRTLVIGPSESNPGVLAFSPDGKRLLTSTNSINGRDQWRAPVITIWDLSSP